jgi:alpha-galactosidase
MDATVVVLAWSTGPLTGAPLNPGRSSRIPLHGLVSNAVYTDAEGSE